VALGEHHHLDVKMPLSDLSPAAGNLNVSSLNRDWATRHEPVHSRETWQSDPSDRCAIQKNDNARLVGSDPAPGLLNEARHLDSIPEPVIILIY